MTDLTKQGAAIVHAVAVAIRNAQGCGLTVEGEYVFCDDPRTKHACVCDCHAAACAAIAAARPLIVRDTLEKAAGVAENVGAQWSYVAGLPDNEEPGSPYDRGRYRAGTEIAQAIRDLAKDAG